MLNHFGKKIVLQQDIIVNKVVNIKKHNKVCRILLSRWHKKDCPETILQRFEPQYSVSALHLQYV